MGKRKLLTEEQKAKMNAQKKQKRASEASEASEAPEVSAQQRDIKAKRLSNALKKKTPEQTEKRKASAAERIANLRKRETPKETSKRKVTDAQQKANSRASISQRKDPERFFKGRKMMLILSRVETNVAQTLLQHGLTLSHDDLQTLCNLRKTAEASEKPNTMETDSNPFIPMVSITTPDTEMPQLTESLSQEEQQKVPVATVLTPQPPVEVQSTSVPADATSQVIPASNQNGLKNQFVAHLNLTKQVPTSLNYGGSTVKKNKKFAPAFPKSSNVQGNNVEPLSKTPLLQVSKGINVQLATSTNIPHSLALKNLPKSEVTSRNVRVVSKVHIITLPEESLQKLQNNKSHIQYLSSKKDPSPQEMLLLPKLQKNQQEILSTGKSVPTIAGLSVQGIPFLSGECMYVVQTHIAQALPDIRKIPNGQVAIRQSPKELVTVVPNAESAPSSTIENCSNSSLNLPQKNNHEKTLHEQARNDQCDYILPDSEKTNCNRHSCVIELALLRTQLNQKSIALDSCNLELDNLKIELEKAKEYIGNLRAQLEENTQTLCSYLAANSS